MRRQNKETDKKDSSRTFAPPDPDSDDSDKLTEQTEKVYEEGYDKEGYDGAGYIEWGFNKDRFN